MSKKRSTINSKFDLINTKATEKKVNSKTKLGLTLLGSVTWIQPNFNQKTYIYIWTNVPFFLVTITLIVTTKMRILV